MLCAVRVYLSDITYISVVLTTCAGAWRYLIGDVVEFTNTKQGEIIISGRTKQFLSICGEHTSIDNLNTAIEKATAAFDFKISDYTVAGFNNDSVFGHHWFIGTDNVKALLDSVLQKINDDYKVERESALQIVDVTFLPTEVFNNYLRVQVKYGAINKFPRVLKGKQLDNWKNFLIEHQIRSTNTTNQRLLQP